MQIVVNQSEQRVLTVKPLLITGKRIGSWLARRIWRGFSAR